MKGEVDLKCIDYGTAHKAISDLLNVCSKYTNLHWFVNSFTTTGSYYCQKKLMRVFCRILKDVTIGGEIVHVFIQLMMRWHRFQKQRKIVHLHCIQIDGHLFL